jgi:hypothetical protein
MDVVLSDTFHIFSFLIFRTAIKSARLHLEIKFIYVLFSSSLLVVQKYFILEVYPRIKKILVERVEVEALQMSPHYYC